MKVSNERNEGVVIADKGFPKVSEGERCGVGRTNGALYAPKLVGVDRARMRSR